MPEVFLAHVDKTAEIEVTIAKNGEPDESGDEGEAPNFDYEDSDEESFPGYFGPR